MTVTAFPPRAPSRLAQTADTGLGLLLVVWTAEALVRLPGGEAVTLAVYAALALRLAATGEVWLPAVLRGWPLFLFPALCLISTAWSVAPTASFVAALQCATTVLAGVYLGARFGLAGLAGLVLTGIGATLVVSTLNFAELWAPVWSGQGGFLGIYTNKNALGQRAAVAVLAALLFLASAHGQARLGWVAALVGMIGLLWASASVTAMVAAATGGGILGLWLMGGRWRLLRLGLSVLALIALGIALAVTAALGIDPQAAALEAVGKSPTLTGRTMLWEVGEARARTGAPLGYGYMAYWAAPGFAQETALLATLYGGTVSAFHNFVLEIRVALGPFGLGAMAALLGYAAWAVLGAPSGPLRAWAAVTLAVLFGLSLLGSSLYRPHEITLLLVAALAAGAHRDRIAARGPPDARTA